MKVSKKYMSVFIVTAVFATVVILASVAFLIMGRYFPVAVTSLQKDLLFIGANRELSVFTLVQDARKHTLTELMSDEKTEFNNSLVLISSRHPIGSELSFASVSEYKNSGVFFDSCAHGSYSELSAYVSEELGNKLYVMSAYRTAEEQDALYKEQGGDTAQRAGESEHQSGLALDVYVSGFAGASFLKSDVGRYVNGYCHKYGFIIRYPDEAKEITGIDFEPWHIRYVGRPHADVISLNGITLEEYLDMLSPDVYYSCGDYVILKTARTEDISVPEGYDSLIISPDNCGNMILTFKFGSNK